MILSLLTAFTMGGVASVFASFEEEEEKEEKEGKGCPPNPPPGMKRLHFRALDHVQAFSGGNNERKLDHVCVLLRGEKKTFVFTD